MRSATSVDREPHLAEMAGDGPERVTALQWARYLADTFGTSGALDALRLYVELGWISEGVRETMTDYVRGLSGENRPERADESDAELPAELESLADTPFHRHAKSLEYVATIENDSLSYVLASAPTDGDVGPDVELDGVERSR